MRGRSSSSCGRIARPGEGGSNHGARCMVLGVGAVAGLGGALCRRFAREGLEVFAVGRTQAKLDAVARAIRADGGRAHALAADVTSAADMARAFESVEKETGAPPELVVYNAGNMAAGPLAEMTDEFFEAAWRVCAFGAFLCGREAARRMVPRGARHADLHGRDLVAALAPAVHRVRRGEGRRARGRPRPRARVRAQGRPRRPRRRRRRDRRRARELARAADQGVARRRRHALDRRARRHLLDAPHARRAARGRSSSTCGRTKSSSEVVRSAARVSRD